MNISWSSHKQIMDKLWTSYEQFMKMSWRSHEEVETAKSWARHDQYGQAMCKSGKDHKQVLNKSWAGNV